MRDGKRYNTEFVRRNVAAARKGLPYEMVRQAVRRGDLPAERFANGCALFVKLSDLEAAFEPVKREDDAE